MEKKYEYSDNEYIQLYRKIINWEWYGDINTRVLFIHCLLRAHWHSGDYKGVHYEPGQFITSLNSLAKETGLSVQNVRTALKHLISTGELTSTLTSTVTKGNLHECRIITVNKWSQYQGPNKKSNKKSTTKLTTSQQEANNSLRNNKNTPSKKDKEKEEAGALSSDEELAAERSSEEEYEEIDFGAMTDEEFERWMKEHGSRNL